MKAKQIKKYQKHGCSFTGNLVVVDYWTDAKKDSRYGRFSMQLSLDYLDKAKELVKAQFGEPVRVLLSIPDYVVEIKTLEAVRDA